jgi:hypothetical protein
VRRYLAHALDEEQRSGRRAAHPRKSASVRAVERARWDEPDLLSCDGRPAPHRPQELANGAGRVVRNDPLSAEAGDGFVHSVFCVVASEVPGLSEIEERQNEHGASRNRRLPQRDRRAGGMHDKGEHIGFGRLSHV